MDRLIADLQKTIQALETVSENLPELAEQADELLDQLFQQKTDLATLSFNPGSPFYQQALQAVSSAAGKVERLAKKTGSATEAFLAVETAITRLARLLDQIAQAP